MPKRGRTEATMNRKPPMDRTAWRAISLGFVVCMAAWVMFFWAVDWLFN